jgi:hypothetical protein
MHYGQIGGTNIVIDQRFKANNNTKFTRENAFAKIGQKRRNET